MLVCLLCVCLRVFMYSSCFDEAVSVFSRRHVCHLMVSVREGWAQVCWALVCSVYEGIDV